MFRDSQLRSGLICLELGDCEMELKLDYNGWPMGRQQALVVAWPIRSELKYLAQGIRYCRSRSLSQTPKPNKVLNMKASSIHRD